MTLSDEQVLWVKRMIVSELNLPVDLKVETIPFVPLLVFKPGEVELTEEMKKEILVIREIYRQDPGLTLRVEAYAGSGKKERAHAEKRMARIIGVLVKECGVPRERINAVSGVRKPAPPMVRISVVPEQPAKGSLTVRQPRLL